MESDRVNDPDEVGTGRRHDIGLEDHAITPTVSNALPRRFQWNCRTQTRPDGRHPLIKSRVFRGESPTPCFSKQIHRPVYSTENVEEPFLRQMQSIHTRPSCRPRKNHP